MKFIGKKIKMLRNINNLTQEELASRCDLTKGYISQLEGPNSYFCPSLKTLFTISDVLSVPVTKLVDVDD